MQLRTLKIDGEAFAVNCDIANIAEGTYIEIHRYDKMKFSLMVHYQVVQCSLIALLIIW